MTGLPEYETILVDIDEKIAVVTLNRPDRMNAWTWPMWREFRHATNQLDAMDEIRAIVLTGAGRAFCAGADLGSGGETFGGNAEALGSAESTKLDGPTRQFDGDMPESCGSPTC